MLLGIFFPTKYSFTHINQCGWSLEHPVACSNDAEIRKYKNISVKKGRQNYRHLVAITTKIYILQFTIFKKNWRLSMIFSFSIWFFSSTLNTFFFRNLLKSEISIIALNCSDQNIPWNWICNQYTNLWKKFGRIHFEI